MDGATDITSLITGLRAETESARKLAAFHLQSSVADAGYATAFVAAEDGMAALGRLVLEESGNTLAYALGSLNGILEHDLGWEEIGNDLAEKAVELVVSRAVINVLRNAFRFLVLVVTRSDDHSDEELYTADGEAVGPNLQTLKPILRDHGSFLDALIERLTSADHALCAYALQFLNSLIRDSINTLTEAQLMRFVKRLQDLNVFSTIEELMRSDTVIDIAAPVLDFQNLTKVMLRCWRDVPVDASRQAHREALDSIRRAAHQACTPRPMSPSSDRDPKVNGVNSPSEQISWQDLGFDTGDPLLELQDIGLLGLMDFTDFVQKQTQFFRKTIVGQTVIPEDRRCPLARVSISVTRILFDHFDVSNSSSSPRSSRVLLEDQLQEGIDTALHPLLLCRDKLHGAVVLAFFRLWDTSGATLGEFDKIEQLARLLVIKHVGGAARQAQPHDIEKAISQTTLSKLRKWQLEYMDDLQAQTLGDDLRLLKDRLRDESTKFVQEQRIRCLLEGAWFPLRSSKETDIDSPESRSGTNWRFVQLSPSRRHLHHQHFQVRPRINPKLTELINKIDVNNITSVVSNVSKGSSADDTKSNSKKQHIAKLDGSRTVTTLVIHGSTHSGIHARETALLELECGDTTVASEWLDGLLMLLDQQPITADTERMISTIASWSLKVRLLNLQWDEDVGAVEDKATTRDYPRPEEEGEYWYDMGEG